MLFSGQLEKENDFGEPHFLVLMPSSPLLQNLPAVNQKEKQTSVTLPILQIKDGLQMAPNHPELLFLEAKRALHNKEKT